LTAWNGGFFLAGIDIGIVAVTGAVIGTQTTVQAALMAKKVSGEWLAAYCG
jgi:hypothetical protein